MKDIAVLERIKYAWNAFRNQHDPHVAPIFNYGSHFGATPPSMKRFSGGNERTIIASIYTRIAIDVAGMEFKHVKVDKQGRYSDDVESQLNTCLTFAANKDQEPRQFRQDIAMAMMDDGVVAIVPVDMTIDPEADAIDQVYSMRVGKIKDWFPDHVRVELFNDVKGEKEEIVVEKRRTAIVQNPFYAVMNERNSTLQRLIRKLNLLDITDDRVGSGKLDIILQLPHVIKTESRRREAEERRSAIEMQLKGSQYGIAYTDGTEKITQLNRPADNTLLNQVELLIKQLYIELGLTESVMDGTADEATMNNYFYRTIEPMVDAITEGMQHAFLGEANNRGMERIRHYKNPFKYTTVDKIAESADKLARNEIITSNETRGFIGLPPSDDPKADLLINSNMPQPSDSLPTKPVEQSEEKDEPTG